MAKDKETEEFRGFAIVMMPNVEEAVRAIAGIDGHQLRGRRLVVNQAVKKSVLVKENATPVTIANRDGAAGLPRRIRKNVEAHPRRSGRNPRRG
jgi:RNA recognition motif-containing protein